MKSLRLYFYIILLTWEIVNCEQYNSDDEESALAFPKKQEELELVNPFSLNYDRANKMMKSKHLRSDSICASDVGCQNDLKQCKDALDNIQFDRLYTARLINLLLSTVQFKEDGDFLSGSITLSGTKAEIDKLREFENEKITTRQVDTILTGMITPTKNTLADTFTFLDHLLHTLNRNKGIITAVLGAVLTLLGIRYANWSTGKVVIVAIGFGILITLFMTWYRLVKEADIRQMVHAIQQKEPPVQCHPEKMGLLDRLMTHIDARDHCFEYYKAMNFNAFNEVTMLDVFSEVLGEFGLRTIGQIGTGCSLFINNVTEMLPFPVNWIAKILCFILMPVVIYLFCGGRLRFWTIFGGLDIGGGGESNRNQQQLQQPTRIELVLPQPISDDELQQRVIKAVAQSKDMLAVGGGDSNTKTQMPLPEKSGASCSNCCCKNSLIQSHVQENENLVIEPMESKGESKEKGDGDS